MGCTSPAQRPRLRGKFECPLLAKPGMEFGGYGSGRKVWGSGLRDEGLGSGGWCLVCGIEGLGSEVCDFQSLLLRV